jgi:DNA invertase Pin-like site-specific DNA recombinase
LAFDSLELSIGRAAAGWEERIVEKVIGYVRVSTEEQGRSGLGLEAQRATIARMADAHDWDVTWVEDAGASGKSLNRPGLQAALAALKAGQADALVVAKLDRLSRSVHDFAGLLLVARRESWVLNALDMGVDTTTSAGTMVAHVMIAVAEWERAVIGDRTSAALQAAQARGVKLGRPRALSKDAELRVFELRAAGLSYARVAEQLNTEAVPTAHGGRAWHASTVSRILTRKTNNRSAVVA